MHSSIRMTPAMKAGLRRSLGVCEIYNSLELLRTPLLHMSHLR
jgi:hypothetical protein